MKNRKRIITTLIGMTLTAQLSPVAYTVVNAQEPTVQGQDQQGQAQQKTGLSDTKITLGGNGCWERPDPNYPSDPNKVGRHEVQISFIDENGKGRLKADVISGYPNNPNHSFHEWYPGEYIRLELINKNGKIKKQFVMTGKDNIAGLRDALNSWCFVYGDSLRIYHGEGMQRTTIKGDVFDETGSVIKKEYDTKGVAKDILNEYQFKITDKGLVQEKQNIVPVNNVNELINELNKLQNEKKGRQETIRLTGNIIFDSESVKKIVELSDKEELIIPEGVTLIGNSASEKIDIDLNNKLSLVLKGNYTNLENVNIKNSNKEGVQVYNSKYSSLKKVTVTGSANYGIYVNGSRVEIEDCETAGNKGGVLISSSLYLKLAGLQDSNVIFKSDSNKFYDKHPVVIKNLALVKKSCEHDTIMEMENNTFKVENPKMGRDKYDESFEPTIEDKEAPFNSKVYGDILKQHHKDIDIKDVEVKEQYKYFR